MVSLKTYHNSKTMQKHWNGKGYDCPMVMGTLKKRDVSTLSSNGDKVISVTYFPFLFAGYKKQAMENDTLTDIRVRRILGRFFMYVCINYSYIFRPRCKMCVIFVQPAWYLNASTQWRTSWSQWSLAWSTMCMVRLTHFRCLGGSCDITGCLDNSPVSYHLPFTISWSFCTRCLIALWWEL